MQVLLPSHETVTEHIEHASGNATRDMLAFQTTIAEQWLFGMTDFQVMRQLLVGRHFSYQYKQSADSTDMKMVQSSKRT